MSKEKPRREDLPEFITTSDNPVGVELGVSSGNFSTVLLQRYNFKEFYCIDSWSSKSHSMEQYLKAYNKLKQFKVANIIRSSFKEFLNEIEDEYFDFIYIDGYARKAGMTEYLNNVFKETIEQWYCKLKPGGIYSGHDYYEKWQGTIEDVNDFAEKHNKQINVTTEKKKSWWIVK